MSLPEYMNMEYKELVRYLSVDSDQYKEKQQVAKALMNSKENAIDDDVNARFNKMNSNKNT